MEDNRCRGASQRDNGVTSEIRGYVELADPGVGR